MPLADEASAFGVEESAKFLAHPIRGGGIEASVPSGGDGFDGAVPSGS